MKKMVSVFMAVAMLLTVFFNCPVVVHAIVVNPIAVVVEQGGFTSSIVGGDGENKLLWSRGNASATGGVMRLVPSSTGKAGTVVRRNQIRLTSGFSTYFQFNIHNPGGGYADGLSFIVYDNDTAQIGESGGGVGYKGIGNSIAVEFDVYPNGDLNDPDGNHVAIMLNGNNAHGSQPGGSLLSYPAIRGGIIHAWVDYNDGTLTATFGTDNSRTGSSNRSISRNVGTFLEGQDVFAGFSASTGGSWADHDVLKWYFKDSYVTGGLSPIAGTYTQAPATLTIVPDNAGTNPTSAAITIMGASGNAMADQTFTVSLDGASVPEPTAGAYNTGGGAIYTFVIPSNLSNGPHTIRAVGNGGVTNFATFTVNKHTVAYNGNGNTGGSVPTASRHNDGATVTVSANSGSLAKTGYEFSGWNTQADGSGTTYHAGSGQITNITSDVTLYAVWNDVTAPNLIAGAVNRTSDTAGTVKFTSDEAGSYYFTIVEDGAAEPLVATSGAGATCIIGENTITDPTGLTAGAKDIYIKGKDVAGNVSTVLRIDIASYGVPSSDAGLATVLGKAITAGAETGTSVAPKTAGISVVNAVASMTAADIVTRDSGATATFYGGDIAFTTPAAGSFSLVAGAGTNVYIKVVAADSTTLYYRVTINRAAADSGGSDTGSETSSTPSDTGVIVLVNGKSEKAATATTTREGDRTVTTVIVDEKKIEEKLRAEGNNATVTIPVSGMADRVVGQLNGQTVKNMETKEAVLEIKTQNVTYTLPASQINIGRVSQQIGRQVELKDIRVSIAISAPAQDTVRVVENTANRNNYQVVVKPVDFSITCSSGNNTVEVSRFNGYVERMVAIPEGIDPNKITTGIVLNSDGTFSHVPTRIAVINSRYYARINSLTNSTYSVIWSPKTFTDVGKHWAKAAVNDMGSRLVVSGAGNGLFEPDRDITRGEFASIVVKALGLMRPGTGKASFSDVTQKDWYYDAVSIAQEYGIISGYGNGTFGPNDRITREQAMAIIARAMKITNLKVNFQSGEAEKLLAAYADSGKASSWAKTSIASCIKTGIVSGRSGKLTAPKENITRAEVAAIVQRLLIKSNLINAGRG